MPGISVSRIPIPFNGGGGFNAAAYWATLISATVENAAPTHVVLTFPVAQTSLGASDFTIAGFTISSASWAGAVLTLVLSRQVLVYDGNLIITFAKTGATATITNNVSADAGYGFWVNPEVPAKMVINESNNLTSWIDRIGAVAIGNSGNYPIFDYPVVKFNGNSWLGSPNIIGSGKGIELPVSLFLLLKVNSWSSEDIIIAGGGSGINAIKLTQKTATPQVDFNNGSSLNNVNLTLNVWHILSITVAADGTALIQVDDNAPVTGNAGTTQPAGFSIGARVDGYARSDIDVIEIIIRKNINATIGAAIQNCLSNRLAFFLT